VTCVFTRVKFDPRNLLSKSHAAQRVCIAQEPRRWRN
jgi:hypothetical protein